MAKKRYNVQLTFKNNQYEAKVRAHHSKHALEQTLTLASLMLHKTKWQTRQLVKQWSIMSL